MVTFGLVGDVDINSMWANDHMETKDSYARGLGRISISPVIQLTTYNVGVLQISRSASAIMMPD